MCIRDSNSTRDLHGCTLYVSLFPCNECAKAIIQSGIRKIVYEDDKYAAADNVIASKKMLNAAGVELVRLGKRVQLNVDVITD